MATGTVQPNLIIEGHGHGVIAKVMDIATAKAVSSRDRYPMDARKMNAKMVPADTSKTFYIVIENDHSEYDDSFIFTEIKTARTGWTFTYKFNGAPQALPYTLVVASRTHAIIEVDIKTPAVPIEGECASTILIARSASTDDVNAYTDAIKCIVVCPVVTYDDILKAGEHLVTDESLTPAWSTYLAQPVVENFIDEETNVVIKDLMGRMNGIQVDEHDKVKAYIIQRVMYRLIDRAIKLAVDGGSYFEPSLRLTTIEAERLWLAIFYGDE